MWSFVFFFTYFPQIRSTICFSFVFKRRKSTDEFDKFVFLLCRLIMSNSTAIWELPDFYHLDNGFFRPQEKKQIQTAYENYIKNTKVLQISIDEQLDETDNSQMLLQSKLQLFQLFVRTQPVNIRSFRFDKSKVQSTFFLLDF